MKTILMLCIWLLPLNSLQAQEKASPISAADLFDFSKLEDCRSLLLQYNGDKVVGSMVLALSKAKDYLTVTDLTRVPSMNIFETTTTISPIPALAMDKYTANGHFGEAPFKGQVTTTDNKSSGSLTLGTTTKTIDEAWPEGTIERAMLFALLPYLKQDTPTEFQLKMFHSMRGGFVDVVVSQGEIEMVKASGVSYRTKRITLRGPESQHFWVTLEKPRRIVKIEVIDTPWAYEYLHDEMDPAK